MSVTAAADQDDTESLTAPSTGYWMPPARAAGPARRRHATPSRLTLQNPEPSPIVATDAGTDSATDADTATAARAARGRWNANYRRRVIATDLVAIVAAVGVGFAVSATPAHLWLHLTLAVSWVVALAASGSWASSAFRSDLVEYRRLIQATIAPFGLIALIAISGGAGLGRSELLVPLALGLALLLVNRLSWHAWRRRERRAGRHVARVLVIGGRASAASLAGIIAAKPDDGYRIAGLCVPQSAQLGDQLNGFEVIGGLEDIPGSIRRTGANVVAVATSDAFSAKDMRNLSWDLVGSGVSLMLAPPLADVAGPRLHIEPLPGLPLIRVEEPRFDGPKVVLKALLDYAAVGVGLLLFAPVMAVVAILIKTGDRGPVFFRQTRVGRDGRLFRVWKFRTMVVDAHLRIDEVRAASGQHQSVFYKSMTDPRITPVGRFLRRASLDELPQLFNVLGGHMSLVGPRPLVPGEGAEIGGYLERRMRVKPGLTGLWQVSGRSAVSAEERIALDLRYVENWSVAGDLAIIAKTVKAVVSLDGAG